jgi:hypothetical protein
MGSPDYFLNSTSYDFPGRLAGDFFVSRLSPIFPQCFVARFFGFAFLAIAV